MFTHLRRSARLVEKGGCHSLFSAIVQQKLYIMGKEHGYSGTSIIYLVDQGVQTAVFAILSCPLRLMHVAGY